MEICSDGVLYVIGGPNGSGKTTLAKKIFYNSPVPLSFMNSDEIADEKSISPYSAGLVMLGKMEEIFSTHNSFVFETTLSDRFHRRLINRAHDLGYKVEFFYVFLSSVEQNLARVRERVLRGGHDVPETTIRRRHDRSLLNFDTVYKMADYWQLYDNAGTEYKLVATGNNANIRVIEPEIYKSFIDRKAAVIAKHVADLAEHHTTKFKSVVATNFQENKK